jgi:hypothetical protein
MSTPYRRALSALLVVATVPAITMCSDEVGAPPGNDEPAGQREAAPEQVDGMLDGPEGPDHPLWYEPLRDMDCADEHLVSSRGQPIPMAGYLLCEAAVGNDDALWVQGERALAQAPAPKNCWEQEAVAALQRLVNARKEHPDATFAFESRRGVACPLVLEALGSPAAPGVVATDIPVSMCGGAPVFLHGNIEYLEPGTVRTVTVGGTTVPVESGNGGLFFRAPASDVADVVPVTVADSEWPVEGVTHLNYEPSPGPCPSIPPPVRSATSATEGGR